jgi:cell division protein FtsB
MEPQVGIWNILTRIVIVLIVVAGVLAIGSRYLPLIQQNERMRREIHRLETELVAEQEASRLLQAEIQLLTRDTDALEREARAQLGLARPGEVIIRFDETESGAFPRIP